MKTKNLDRDETLKLIDLHKTRINFNNDLNRFVRKFMKEHNLDTYGAFNGFHDEPTQEMLTSLQSILDEQTWMGPSLKQTYLSACSAIFGGVYSPATNDYLRRDLHDLEKHLEEIEHSADNREEENSEFRVERDLASNRMNLYFDGIPSDEIRILLKRNGFRWSPYLGAWTRQLTSNAEASLIKIKQKMGIN